MDKRNRQRAYTLKNILDQHGPDSPQMDAFGARITKNGDKLLRRAIYGKAKKAVKPKTNDSSLKEKT